MLMSMYFTRPAPAGRAVLALAFSLALHVALLLTTAGKPDGGIVINSSIELPDSASKVLQVMVQEHAADATGLATNSLEKITSATKPGEATLATDDGPVASNHGILPLITPTRYYLPNELDARPQIRSRINPTYPQDAFEKGIAAELTLRIFIDEQGRVENVAVPGKNEVDPFVAAAIAAFRSATYTPGIKNGVPVKSLLLIKVNFEALDIADAFRGSTY
jgi:TonB family protein